VCVYPSLLSCMDSACLIKSLFVLINECDDDDDDDEHVTANVRQKGAETKQETIDTTCYIMHAQIG